MYALKLLQFKKQKMKKILLLFFSVCISFFNVFCQKQISIGKSCSYYGEKMPTQAYTFSSDNEAEAALKLITDASGLSSNFTIVAGNVPNACATMIYNAKTKELERYIIYNQTFMYNISQKINYWASISILAHEVGHHLNGHSLMPGGSRPSLELEADKFSGFILAKLGATLDDAQSAINSLVSEQGSTTHPPKSARLAAIASGWFSSQSKNKISEETSINNTPKLIELGMRFDGGMVYVIDPSKHHGKLMKFLDQELNYFDFMSMGESFAEWRLPTIDDYELMYQNLEKKGIYEFILDIKREPGYEKRNCNSANYWIPNSLNDIDDSNCGGSAKTFNFCKTSDKPMPCCPKNNYFPIVLVKNF